VVPAWSERRCRLHRTRQGANKTIHLDTKTRELVAVAIAVSTRCDGCIGARWQACALDI